jgi:UDP-N-acetylglucosamine 4-epimerase
MRYLVTGGAGFIGSNLTETLLNQGHEVVVLDNLSTGKLENIKELEKITDSLEFIKGDLRDLETCRGACDTIDYVLHQGALGSVPRSIDNPIATTQSNVNGTLNILVAAKDAGVKRLVYAASSSAYGDIPTLPKVETMQSRPISPYAASKFVGEMYCRIFFDVYGLETISLRYFNVFGRRQDPNSTYAAVIPSFVSSLLKDKNPTIYGDGTQSRDFTYIDNVIDANLKACEAPKVACGQVFNIACGKTTTLNDLYTKLCELLEKDTKPQYASRRPGDVKHSFADISKARQLLGYNPQYDLFQGLELAIEWYKANAKFWNK